MSRIRTHKRDYVHVSDLVRVISSIVSEKIPPGQYEVGTGIGTSVLDLVSMVEKETGTKIDIEKKEFVVPEAESLFAKAPVLPDMIPIREGVRRVIQSLKFQ